MPNFQYSDALKNARVIWNETALDNWLDNSEKLIPNNDMAFRVLDHTERAAIIGYLKTLGEK